MIGLACADRRPVALVADDDEGARLLIESALADANVRVVQAQDAREALAVFPRERPDIVLLDVNMPGMDGYEACRTLRALPGGERVPVLMVTAYDGAQSIDLAYAAGATDFLTKSGDWAIIAHRVRYLLRAASAAANAKMADAPPRRAGRYDALTGLLNRASFRDRLARAIMACARRGQRLALMFLDFDGFKQVNDAYGHAVGDQALARAAKRIAASIPGKAAAPDGAPAPRAAAALRHRLGRVGGDRFCLFLANVGEAGEVAAIARGIFAELARPIGVGAHEIVLDASMGIAIYPGDGEDSETLLRCAEAAAYQAREDGGNNYRFFAGATNAQVLPRPALEAELHRALEKNEFVLHYQPLVSVSDGRVVGVEALMRWQHPHLGLVMPGQFIGAAEETGLIVPIGEWALQCACREAAAWGALVPRAPRLSVNLSPAQIRHPALAQSLRHALDGAGLDASQLTLELHERALAGGIEAPVLQRLAATGARLCLDNFSASGGVYARLRGLPLHALKIDRAIVLELPGNRHAAALARACAGMSDSLMLVTGAEGVETEAQLRFLRAIGCEIYQGYLFGRPLAAAALAQLLQREAGKAAAAGANFS